MDEQKDVTTTPSIGSKEKGVQWYEKTFAGTKPDARMLLETYSGIPPEKVDEYVLETVRTVRYRTGPDRTGQCPLSSFSLSLWPARQGLGRFPLPMHRPIPLPQPQPQQAAVLRRHARPHQAWRKVS